ncbi:MAG: hypothetical protein S4CHLAM20_09220 [Chlamydiia bacterium]|nr:hypothetical protein [Chlamydiia bacterium]
MRIAENLTACLQSLNSYDCINLSLDGSPSSNLSFPDLDHKIEEILNLDKKICLELFLNLQTESFSFYNPLEFSIRKRSLEVLLERISNIPEEKISHIILYRGSIDFSNHIKRNVQLNEEYLLWKKDLLENDIDEEHLLHIYSSKLISDFFHSLAAILPDHIKAALLLSLPQELGVAKTSELISEETFSHIDIGIKNPPFFHEGISWGQGSGFHSLSFTPQNSLAEDEVKTAVILPFFGNCNYKRFEKICDKLKKRNIPFKVIEENLLNEKWFDIDVIIFDHDSTSFDGKRMVDGFIAAGGKAFVFDDEKTYERENVTSEYGYLNFESFNA